MPSRPSDGTSLVPRLGVGREPTTTKTMKPQSTAWGFSYELEVGLEPTTCGLRNRCSTTELLQRKKAYKYTQMTDESQG